MKIALISYEYPPDTAVGGIATYTYQIAHLMQRRGHPVEVFAGSAEQSGYFNDQGVGVHRVGGSRAEFAAAVAPVFQHRHRQVGFEVVESPEIGAESQGISALVPDLPLVIKLHTPTYLINRVNHVPPTGVMQLRRIGGALRRGQRPTRLPGFTYQPATDLERLQTLKATLITTPSQALGQELVHTWQIDPNKIRPVPNPYLPTPAMLTIPPATHTQRVTFLGRLEIRKGVLELAAAIPQVLRHQPQTVFRWVGAPWPSPRPGLDMQQYLLKRLHRYRTQLEFTGAIPLDQIPAVLAETDICVFPSRWENFPGVCLEAMAAARGIVGSQAGGMVEMLEGGRVGCLVNPTRPQAIAQAITHLLTHPDQRIALGTLARQRVLTEYSLDTIGARQEAVYREAIQEQRARATLVHSP